MLKKEVRKKFIEQRALLSDAERMKMDDLILIQLQKVNLPFLNVILSYWPIEEKHEINTHIISDFLLFRNPSLTVCYPQSDFNKLSMEAIISDDNSSFEKNEYGIYEPISGRKVPAATLDLVIVPLLGCDHKGQRVGFGKGFYDRYLKQCKEDCIIMGMSYFEPVDIIEDADQFDVPLNLCITPQKAYVF